MLMNCVTCGSVGQSTVNKQAVSVINYVLIDLSDSGGQ